MAPGTEKVAEDTAATKTGQVNESRKKGNGKKQKNGKDKEPTPPPKTAAATKEPSLVNGHTVESGLNGHASEAEQTKDAGNGDDGTKKKTIRR